MRSSTRNFRFDSGHLTVTVTVTVTEYLIVEIRYGWQKKGINAISISKGINELGEGTVTP
jgi:hypothetical protein